MKRTWVIIGLICYTFFVQAQEGVGSYESSNGLEVISADTYKLVFSESLYLGAKADWHIDGEVHIYSRQVWISPAARISGSGKLYIHSPGDNPFYESWTDEATKIDANNGDQAIDVNIVLTNPEGLRLTDLPDVELSAKHYPQLAKKAALRLSK